MAAKKVGTLIKEARLAADLTQEQLAKKSAGLRQLISALPSAAKKT